MKYILTILLLFISISCYAQAPNAVCAMPKTTSGILGLWSMNEAYSVGTVGTAYDTVGVNSVYNAFTTTDGGSSTTTCKFSNGWCLNGYGTNNGLGSYLTTAGNQTGIGGGTELTITAWIKPKIVNNANNLGGIFNIATVTDKIFFVYCTITAGDLFINITNSAKGFECSTVGGILTANVWQFVAVTVNVVASNNHIVKFYVNGVNKALVYSVDDNTITAIPTPAAKLNIGAYGTTGQYGHIYGFIDDVAYFNRALSAQEVAEYYYRNPRGQ